MTVRRDVAAWGLAVAVALPLVYRAAELDAEPDFELGVPPVPALAGLRLNHAALAIVEGRLRASAAVPLDLLP